MPSNRRPPGQWRTWFPRTLLPLHRKRIHLHAMCGGGKRGDVLIQVTVNGFDMHKALTCIPPMILTDTRLPRFSSMFLSIV